MTDLLKKQAPNGSVPERHSYRVNDLVYNRFLGLGRVIEIYPVVAVRFFSRPDELLYYNQDGKSISEFVDSNEYDLESFPNKINPEDTLEIKRIKKLLTLPPFSVK